MTERYFTGQEVLSDRVLLTGPEAHHLAHVMRRRPGEEVVLFDGTGQEFVARIDRVAKSQVELEVLSRSAAEREPRVRVNLGVAMPKGDRQKWLVEKATELGVYRLVPVNTTRGVAEVGRAGRVRLQRAVIEASKQCGRSRLMEIAEPQSLADYCQFDSTGLKLIAQRGGTSLREAARAAIAAAPAEVWLAIGPEGGFTEDELSLATSHAWSSVDLGRRVLRVETAAVLLAGLFTGLGD